ncbi:MAG: ABC transporter permease [Verrucomicrobiae bacterium]|nr:ABC transporter permease [Verrucomicrobiae bacterium]
MSQNPASLLKVDLTTPELLTARLSGDWSKRAAAFPGDSVRQALQDHHGVRALEFDTTSLGGWDSRLVAQARQWSLQCQSAQVEFRSQGLPDGVQDLLRLASAVPESGDARRSASPPSWLARIGSGAIRAWNDGLVYYTFLGEIVLALFALIRGRAQFRTSDLMQVLQETGPSAFGIVALINFLIGLILAFVGATSLAQFGASIYVADMVAIGTVREMGCIMTAIILCGRTGAAFAARLGTMKVNEEIAALTTFGLSPIEFLVLPRMLALVVMMPLLVVFADLISISGGMFVSVSMLDVTATEYLSRTVNAIKLKSFLLGISKGAFFGFLVAYTGCLYGMQCGRNAEAVGRATTQAVVAGITAIVAADGVFAVLCNALGI